MKLSVKQRIVIGNSLPANGNIATLKMLREFKESLSLSLEEYNAIGYTIKPNGSSTWSLAKEKEMDQKDIEINDAVRAAIVSSLQKMDRENKLTNDHLDIWDIFFPEEK